MRNTRYPAYVNRSGFSLLELLTVVAVIAVLSSLLLAGIGPVRGMVDESRCATNLRTLAQLAQVQAADNGGYVPQAMWDIATNSAARPNLLDYGLTAEITRCSTVETVYSYGINIKLIAGSAPTPSSPKGSQWGPGDEQYWKRGRYKYSDIDATKAMIFAETNKYCSEDNLDALQFRHNGRVQAAFADGHVDKFTRADLTSNEDDPTGKLFWTRGITTH